MWQKNVSNQILEKLLIWCQFYSSAFVYQGPPVVYSVATELAELLRQNGLKNVQQAVGIDAKWMFLYI